MTDAKHITEKLILGTSIQMTTVVYTTEYNPVFGADAESDILLEDEPTSILSTLNPELTTGFIPMCSQITPRDMQLPLIPERCTMTWQLGDELARGSQAVVFRTKKNTHVVHVLQLEEKDALPDKRFRRDVHTRLLVHCMLQNSSSETDEDDLAIGVDVAVDAFICHHKTRRYGIIVANQADSTVLRYFVSLPTVQDREVFLVRFKRALDRLLETLHSNGIAHRDIHHGNILMVLAPKEGAKDTILLTDFESAIGSVFHTDERVVSAYINNESSDVVYTEMVCMHEFLQGLGSPDWDSLSDYGLTETMMINIRDRTIMISD